MSAFLRGAALVLLLMPALAIARPNRAPSVSLTAPAQGASFPAPAQLTLAANASDSDGSVQRVDFYQGAQLVGSSSAAPYTATTAELAAGSYSFTARAIDNAGAVATSSAVSVTVVAPPPDLILSPAAGAALYGNAVTVSGRFVGDPATTSILVDNGNSTRLAVPSGNSYSVSVPLFRGPNTLTVTVARIDRTYDTARITVSGHDAPYVALKSPTASSFDAPEFIELEAEALSPGGTVSRVDFLRDSVLLGSAAAAPYRHTWSSPAPGSYTLTARAVDDHGAVASDSRPVTVNAPNALPYASLTAPGDGALYTAPATVTLQADASDPDGSIARVEFLRDGLVFASDAVPPYAYTWSGVSPGTYALAARAIDNRGGETTSATATIMVRPPNAIPSVSLDEPAAGASFETPAQVPLRASASDSDGAVARVEFYEGTRLLGTDPSAPYEVIWSATVSGTYTLSARAVDDAGAVGESSPVEVIIKDPPPNQVPTASLTRPVPGTRLYAPASVALEASASDADGTVARVEFYAGETLLGSDASEPYAFTWSGVGAGSYALTARAVDDRGAVGVSAAVALTVEGLGIALTSPQDGASLSGDQVVVSGTFAAPPNSGITINGIVAAIDGNSFHANVPLVAGANALSALLTTPAGQTAQHAITVQGDGMRPFLDITPDRVEGVAPMAVVFTVQNDREIEASVQVGASSFTVPPGAALPVTITYSAGTHMPQFDASNAAGETMSKRFVIVAKDPVAVDQQFSALWNGMNDALIAGDKSAALAYMSEGAKAKYGPVFDVLMPEYAEIVATWSAPVRGEMVGDVAEYAIVTNFEGARRVYLVYFIRGPDGVWRLESM